MKEFEHYLLEFMVLIFSLAVFYTVKHYWPKYFEAKATNQATKEDIGEITKIVENIKSDLSQQGELLKAQLSFANQHKLNIKTAEREAIFDFNKQKSVWLYSLLRFSFYKYNIENYKETIQLTYLDLQKRQYEFDLAEAHLVLLFQNETFLDLNKRLVEEITELTKIASQITYDLFYAFSKAEFNLAVEQEPIEQSKIRYTLNEELLSVHQKLNKLTSKQFEKINRLDSEMREVLYTRLKMLDNEDYS